MIQKYIINKATIYIYTHTLPNHVGVKSLISIIHIYFEYFDKKGVYLYNYYFQKNVIAIIIVVR